MVTSLLHSLFTIVPFVSPAQVILPPPRPRTNLLRFCFLFNYLNQIHFLSSLKPPKRPRPQQQDPPSRRSSIAAPRTADSQRQEPPPKQAVTTPDRRPSPIPLTVEIFPRFGPKTAQNGEYLDSERGQVPACCLAGWRKSSVSRVVRSGSSWLPYWVFRHQRKHGCRARWRLAASVGCRVGGASVHQSSVPQIDRSGITSCGKNANNVTPARSISLYSQSGQHLHLFRRPFQPLFFNSSAIRAATRHGSSVTRLQPNLNVTNPACRCSASRSASPLATSPSWYCRPSSSTISPYSLYKTSQACLPSG